MSDNLARDYAERMAADIRADVDAGTPYGIPGDDADETEPLSAYDWLSDVLDIKYRIGSDGSYRSALVMVSCGGPNAYIDTSSNDVVVYWGSDNAHWGVPASFCAGLDEAIEEMRDYR